MGEGWDGGDSLMNTVYGITNCETVKKARAWLDKKGIAYQFHDFKKDGLDKDTLNTLLKGLDWETLLNRKGTTWRLLPDEDKTNVNAKKAAALMLARPTVIKRPVLVVGGKISKYYAGFSEALYQEIFGAKK